LNFVWFNARKTAVLLEQGRKQDKIAVRFEAEALGPLLAFASARRGSRCEQTRGAKGLFETWCCYFILKAARHITYQRSIRCGCGIDFMQLLMSF
jgi:hypothetical protein